ncbi:phytoene desaturase family protein, partial [Corynebacterium casei]
MSAQPHAVVVGSGPNGLSAAARLLLEGWDVDVYESAPTPGGAARSTASLFGGAIVDLGAAGHPFGVASPAFQKLKLEEHGLTWKNAPYEMAHPLDGKETAFLSGSIEKTAAGLGSDAKAWDWLHGHVVRDIDKHLDNLLGPMLSIPRHPVHMLRFGPPALVSAATLAKTLFKTEQARALLASSAVHAITSPSRPLTGAFGILFGALGQSRGWPVAKGGTQAIVDALVSVIYSNGGRIHTGVEISDLRELPAADAIILNLTPRQILQLHGTSLAPKTRKRLEKWKYGPAVYKVDFLLNAPVPWTDPRVGTAATVHVGGTVDEISFVESEVAAGRMPDRPFVMVCQQYAADPTRGLTLWSYAHVPHGYIERYPGEIRELITGQIERFAPGFRETVVDATSTSPCELEAWNANLVGGD